MIEATPEYQRIEEAMAIDDDFGDEFQGVLNDELDTSKNLKKNTSSLK